MSVRTRQSPLKIAVSFGTLSPQLASLLLRQRTEEPETPVLLHEVVLAEQLRGLKDGRYDAGLALTDAPDHSLSAQPLWPDELAVALPVKSPLLAFAAVPLKEMAHYPVIRWCTQTCEPLSQLVDSLLEKYGSLPQQAPVRTYEVMATLVSAGYGIGLGAKSRIAALRSVNVVMRPLAGDRYDLTTYLLCPGSAVPALDRLAERAQAI
jgi:DNA-binding transcriptional LysR family regulator